ncbi:hypothetical protein RMSM_06247 [Rhodopirellula maiorica SM1]|uniref:Uncharacterized protein n=1 Tax=Rhodopirellula maiorica SM1 TaxID=1265738 RepID=M5RN76_9BACT|nr:hypothetical protein RMSM_06247 [Rhodopirellula maiorica SM1]
MIAINAATRIPNPAGAGDIDGATIARNLDTKRGHSTLHISAAAFSIDTDG